MSSSESDESQLDRYLDEQMSQQEATDFFNSVDGSEMEQVVELQSKIDDSLRRLLSGVAMVDEKEIENQFLRTGGGDLAGAKTVKSDGLAGGQLIKIAVAAMLLVAVGLGVWFNSAPQNVEPISVARHLTEVYAEKALDFRPYYICDDDNRFAETFRSKLGMAMALAELPSDRKMLGLSYLGGVSRNTVAMLAEVQGKDVIVFVDREGEAGIDIATEPVDPDLNVFVERKGGLVFVEVTPLKSANLIEYFRIID